MDAGEPAEDLRPPTRVGVTRLNFGCGDYPLDATEWVNIDETADSKADFVCHVPPIPYPDESIAEVWGCHFLEHLDRTDANEFLSEAFRVLKPGGLLGLVVPDTREIMKRYIAGTGDHMYSPDGQVWRITDLDDVCHYFIFSTIQPSHHKWAYEAFTLQRLIESHGFRILNEIDRWGDPRLGTGQWYQCGWQAVKP